MFPFSHLSIPVDKYSCIRLCCLCTSRHCCTGYWHSNWWCSSVDCPWNRGCRRIAARARPPRRCCSAGRPRSRINSWARSVGRHIRMGNYSDRSQRRPRSQPRACKDSTGTRSSSARSSAPRNRSGSDRCSRRNCRSTRRYSSRDSLGIRRCQSRS